MTWPELLNNVVLVLTAPIWLGLLLAGLIVVLQIIGRICATIGRVLR